jgi:SET domain-containing protein
MYIVKDSSVEGRGLFSTQFIKKNTKLSGFQGIEMSFKEFNEIYKKDYRFCYPMMRQHKIINGKDFDNPSRYCNESKEPNVALIKRGLYTLRDIEPDEELFLMYPHYYPRDYKL